MISLRMVLALPSNFFSSPSDIYYLHVRHRSPTPHYTLALFGALHLTGEGTGGGPLM